MKGRVKPWYSGFLSLISHLLINVQTTMMIIARTESEEKALLVGESGLFLTLGSGTSSARNKNLRPLINRNISLISGKYDLRNHFWPLESGFLMRKSEKKGPNFWGTLLPILRLTFLELSSNFRKFGIKKNGGYFFSIWWVFRTHVTRRMPSISAGRKGKDIIRVPHIGSPVSIRLCPFTKSVPTSAPNSPTSGGEKLSKWKAGLLLLNTSQLLLLGKFEYGGGPIFKVVLEC